MTMIFEQACAEESEETLCRLAADRLAYPVVLSGQAGERYRRFLAGQQSTLAELLVKQQDITGIREFVRGEILTGDGMMTAAPPGGGDRMGAGSGRTPYIGKGTGRAKERGGSICLRRMVRMSHPHIL